MKNKIFIIAIVCAISITAQEKTKAFKTGEWLRFKMSYSGFLKAGNATLAVEEDSLDGKSVYHVTGKGWTTGMIKWFFKVEDDYQSYFDKETGKPYLFKRKIDEGGYKKHRHTKFNYKTKQAYVQDFTDQKDTIVYNIDNIQDMISSFYFLRNYDVSRLKKGDEIALDMFMDAKIYPFKLRFLGVEILDSKFGKVKTLRFRPIVQSGRVFKAQESVTIWVTADANRVPIKMKASLAVGSLRAELDAYKGLANSFEIIYD